MQTPDDNEIENLKETSDESAQEAREAKADLDEAVAEKSREEVDNPPSDDDKEED